MAGNNKSGRHRLPISDHLDSGNYRPSRHGAIPDSATGVPVTPRDLDPAARACWKSVVGDLVSRGLAKQIDTLALRQLCEMWSLYKAALKVARKTPTATAACRAVATYRREFDDLAKQFGLSFASRQKLRIQPKEAPAASVATRNRA